MKRKKDVIKKAVLASVLAMSLNNVVWAAEGVDAPFILLLVHWKALGERRQSHRVI